MKKGIIILLILLLSTASMFAQLQGFGTYRIANATTPLGLNVAKGSAIFDINSGDVYVLKKDEKSTTTLSGMVLGTDYINLQLWEGKKFAEYLNQPLLTSSTPQFHGLTITGEILPTISNTYNIGSASNYFARIFTGNLYAYATSYLNGNVNVGVNLDVTGVATATKFVTAGGTSNDFAKGDGSLDTNTYITLNNLPDSLQKAYLNYEYYYTNHSILPFDSISVNTTPSVNVAFGTSSYISSRNATYNMGFIPESNQATFKIPGTYKVTYSITLKSSSLQQIAFVGFYTGNTLFNYINNVGVSPLTLTLTSFVVVTQTDIDNSPSPICETHLEVKSLTSSAELYFYDYNMTVERE